MSFDLSRVRFKARDDFLGVVVQQGRVQLDSEWNEWVDQLVRRIQAGNLDTVGAAVVPREPPDGFSIQADGGKLTIGRGRIYVDGVLAENHGEKPDSWERRLAEEVGTAPTWSLRDIVKMPPNWWVLRQHVDTRHSDSMTDLAIRNPSDQCVSFGLKAIQSLSGNLSKSMTLTFILSMMGRIPFCSMTSPVGG